MAMQPVDRQKAKHSHKVAPRYQPPMVRRSNKSVIVDHAPIHIATQIDHHVTYWGRHERPTLCGWGSF